MKRAVQLLAIFVGLSLAIPAQAKGKKIDFTARDLSGKYVRLSDYEGKVVEIAFWATFCKSCQKKLKHLQKWYAKYKDRGFVVLAVSVDGPETQAKVKPVVRRYKLKYPVVIDKDATISKLFNPKRSTPYSVFIKDGKKIKEREGFQVSDIKGMEAEIKELLK